MRGRFDLRQYRVILPDSWYSPWLTAHAFQSIYAKVHQNTLYTLSAQTSLVSGDYIKAGVLRGGSACLLGIQAQQQNKKFFACDNWSSISTNKQSENLKYAAPSSLIQFRKLYKKEGLQNVIEIDGVLPKSLENIIHSLGSL